MLFSSCEIQFLLMLFTARAISAGMIDDINSFITRLMSGVQLTAAYTVSLGTNYPPIEEDVTFWCVKPEQNDVNQTFINDTDIQAKIDFTKPVNFVIHGWLGGLYGGNIYLVENADSTNGMNVFVQDVHLPQIKYGRNDENLILHFDYNIGWIQTTALSWAQFADSNVCAVDWSRLANYDYSVAAMKHTKMVTDTLESFMKFLIDNGMNIKLVSIAGHSLGAQIAGLIGEKFEGKIDSIYGLDPAGPGFTFPFDIGESSRLDPTDAKYVQCVLTSRGTFGTTKDCGHANFIINGGYIQPGCYSILCSHSRAHDYFEESLDPGNIYVAEKCSGSIRLFFTRILKKSCTNVTDRLGIYSARTPGRYFMKTNASPPYSLVNDAVD